MSDGIENLSVIVGIVRCLRAFQVYAYEHMYVIHANLHAITQHLTTSSNIAEHVSTKYTHRLAHQIDHKGVLQ